MIRIKADANAYRRTVPELAQHVSPLVGEPWRPWPYLLRMWEEISSELQREEGGRIIINAPPRHGKSVFTSHWLPVWFLETFPTLTVILCSYAAELAHRWGRRVRDTFIHSDELWTKVKPEVGAANRWETTEGGGMITAGVGGPITGAGGHLLIIDDPIKNWQDAHSDVLRSNAQDWFLSTFYTRAEPGATIVVNMTRWHELDMTGWLRRTHTDKWKHVVMPALAEDGDYLGRAPGEALCPERYTAQALAEISRSLQRKFAGLYQQRPLPAEGAIIKLKSIRFWSSLPVAFDVVVISVDAAFKDLEENDYVVLQVWGRRGANFYLVEQIRDHLDFTATIAALKHLIHRFPSARAKLIEDKANGPAIISALKNKVPGLIPVEPHGSKEARLSATSPLWDAGNVHIPEERSAPWVTDYIAEVTSFPSSAYDDQVDATSQALNYLTERHAGPAFLTGLGGGAGFEVPLL